MLIPVYFLLLTTSAKALPGENTDQVAAWVNAHPTLRPDIGDGLSVNKSDTPARRFSFQATVLPPGRVKTPSDRRTVRSERVAVYDQINGVTFEQLREALRTIYGLAIYQDYQQARLIYAYPSSEIADLGRRLRRPLLELQQGELLLGKRFAYWLEITQTDDEQVISGQFTILLPEDLEKLEIELRDH
ncbi:MAG: hypothetical protein F6K09_29015 [Merismopedia sp. SIO2A8]|nr:hypothetical protein [Symploca sp. SIO2B6]NET52575.1 hypothetical protein [Merismopedia sp. SIO2A8]